MATKKELNELINDAERRLERIPQPGDGPLYFALVFGDCPLPDNLGEGALVVRLPADYATDEDVARFREICESRPPHEWTAEHWHANRQLHMLSPEWPEYIAGIRARITAREIDQWGEQLTTWDDDD